MKRTMAMCAARRQTVTLRRRLAAAFGGLVLTAISASTVMSQSSVEPSNVQKDLSREVYQSYVGKTIIGKFGTPQFYQLWLYGDGTFAQYQHALDAKPPQAPSQLRWTGSSWWASGVEGDRRICLRPANAEIVCRPLTPDRRAGDHWFETDGEVVLLSGVAWSAPQEVPLSPPNNPAAEDPAAQLDAEPSEAAKAISRKIYANYVGNTVVCRFSGRGGCMLWLFANGTFIVHMAPGRSPTPIDLPVAERTGVSWWAAGVEADRKLCLRHGHPVGMRKSTVCYHLDPGHAPGDVWFEADDTLALLYGRN
jgi:hypothetical protein